MNGTGMKATGMVRPVDVLGRVVLPKELRKIFGIENGDSVEVFVEDDKIILKKYQPGCYTCSAVESEMSYFYGKLICNKCVNDICQLSAKIKQAMA